MSFLRSALTAVPAFGPSSARAARFVPGPTSVFARFSSSAPPRSAVDAAVASPSAPAAVAAAAAASASPAAKSGPYHMPGPEATSHIIPPSSTDSWWKRAPGEFNAKGSPGNHYTGRSFPVRSGGGDSYLASYRRLSGMLSRAGVKRELRIQEYWEKPGDRKRRIQSERHRRRFQEEVRTRVQMVQMLRSRK